MFNIIRLVKWGLITLLLLTNFSVWSATCEYSQITNTTVSVSGENLILNYSWSPSAGDPFWCNPKQGYFPPHSYGVMYNINDQGGSGFQWGVVETERVKSYPGNTPVATEDAEFVSTYGGSGSGSLSVPILDVIGLSYAQVFIGIKNTATSEGRLVTTYAPTTVAIPSLCSFATPSVELSHGELTPEEITGHEASGTISVLCNKPGTYTISTNPTGPLLLKNGEIESALTIDTDKVTDAEPGGQFTLSAGSSVIKLTSTLTAKKTVTAGVFSGSLVVIINAI